MRYNGVQSSKKEDSGMAVINNELGAIHINADVIAMLVGKSAEQCYGIVGMAAKRATDGLAELLNWENITRGVKIKDEPDGIVIDVCHHGVWTLHLCRS
jgi:uncharacterized alkaline shock family protein YloU